MSTTEQPPMEILIPSLPNDIALNILARLPRQYHAVLSAVSKSIRSAVSSPQFFTIRSLLNRAESVLYLGVGCFGNDHWFAVHRNPNPINNSLLRFAPVPGIPIEKQLMGSAYASVGPKIYVIGGCADLHGNGISSDVWVLDCRSQTWERGPSLLTPRVNAEKAVVGGKIYVAGGKKPGVVVLDPVVGRWEIIPSPLDDQNTFCFGLDAVGGRLRFSCSGEEFWFDPTTTNTWEFRPNEQPWMPRKCEVDGKLYRCHSGGKFEVSEKGIGRWKELKGADERKPKYVCGHTLLNLEGRLVVAFAEVRFGETVDSEKGKVGVWCAEIDVSKDGNGDWWGRVHWSEKVPLLPEVTWGIPEEEFYESLYLYLCNCFRVSL